MFAFPTEKKPSRIVFVALGAIFVLYLGAMYSYLRQADSMTLVPLSLTYENGLVHRFIARQELWRQIRLDEASGSGALSMALTLSASEYYDSEQAIELAEEILSSGVDADSKNEFGFTPLHSAVNLGEPTSVEFLLKHCANPGVPWITGPDGTDKGINALELAYLIEKERPEKAQSGVIDVLERDDLGLNCVYN
jgi:hypothetical protein